MSPERNAGAPRGLRILLVEDELLVALMLEDLLTELGHRVVAMAPNVKAALDHAQRDDVDMALLDVNLDGQPVFPVAERLAARGTRFAFATGYGRAGLPESFLDRPVLNKPVAAEDLKRVIAGLFA